MLHPMQYSKRLVEISKLRSFFDTRKVGRPVQMKGLTQGRLNVASMPFDQFVTGLVAAPGRDSGGFDKNPRPLGCILIRFNHGAEDTVEEQIRLPVLIWSATSRNDQMVVVQWCKGPVVVVSLAEGAFVVVMAYTMDLAEKYDGKMIWNNSMGVIATARIRMEATTVFPRRENMVARSKWGRGERILAISMHGSYFCSVLLCSVIDVLS